MPFSLLALIIFLIVYAIIAYGVYSSRKMQYDERQKYMQSIAYKYGFFTLILATAVNGFIEYYTKSSWGTPLAESFIEINKGAFRYGRMGFKTRRRRKAPPYPLLRGGGVFE